MPRVTFIVTQPAHKLKSRIIIMITMMMMSTIPSFKMILVALKLFKIIFVALKLF